MGSGREPSFRDEDESGHDPREKWGSPYPFCTSDVELLALEEQYDTVVATGKRIRYVLNTSEGVGPEIIRAYDDMLKFFGIHDEVVEVPSDPLTLEMFATTGD